MAARSGRPARRTTGRRSRRGRGSRPCPHPPRTCPRVVPWRRRHANCRSYAHVLGYTGDMAVRTPDPDPNERDDDGTPRDPLGGIGASFGGRGQSARRRLVRLPDPGQRIQPRLADRRRAGRGPAAPSDPLRRGRAGAHRRRGRGDRGRHPAAGDAAGRDDPHDRERPGPLRRDGARRAVPPPRERPRADGVPAAAAPAGAVHRGRVLPDAGRLARSTTTGSMPCRSRSSCP